MVILNYAQHCHVRLAWNLTGTGCTWKAASFISPGFLLPRMWKFVCRVVFQTRCIIESVCMCATQVIIFHYWHSYTGRCAKANAVQKRAPAMAERRSRSRWLKPRQKRPPFFVYPGYIYMRIAILGAGQRQWLIYLIYYKPFARLAARGISQQKRKLPAILRDPFL